MLSQLPLGLHRDTGFSLDNYFPGPNAEVLRILRSALASETVAAVLLEGDPDSGKTHLLQALGGLCMSWSNRVGFLPLGLAGEQFQPDAFQGLSKQRNVFLDDVDAIAGRPAWESALAESLQQERSGPLSVVLSARGSGDAIGFGNPRLKDYLAHCRRLRLEPLTGEDRIQAIRRHAKSRGIEMSVDVARYLSRQVPGGIGEWINALNALDYAALANKRRFTKPFIRSVLKPPA